MSIRFFLSIIIIFSISSSQAFADYMEDALRYCDKKNWYKANNSAKAYHDPVLMKIVRARQFLDQDDKTATFEQMTSFATLNPHWPKLYQIKKNAEDRITSSTNKHAIVKWFSENHPQTSKGYKYYALAAKGHISDPIKLQKVIKNGWIYGNFSEEEEKKFLHQNQTKLTEEDHIHKLDALLWNDQRIEAKKLASKLNSKAKTYMEAFIALRDNKSNKNQLFSSLPHTYKYNSGILYYYLLGFKKDDVISHELAEMILHVQKNDLHATEWWKLQNLIAKNLLQQKHYRLAYQVVSNHNGQCPKDSSEAEWLAGWIALRFLGSPKRAYDHFENMYAVVKQPISLARGCYWLGLSALTMKNRELANKWFREAAGYNFTFYGQAAMLELNNHNITLPTNKYKITPSDKVFYQKNEFARATNIFIKHGRKDQALMFAKAAITVAHDPGEVALIVDSIKSCKNLYHTTEIAKVASQKGYIVSHNYPTPYKFQPTIEPALTYSIILRESVFDQYAISHANAHGLMQVLPSTACKVAKKSGTKCNTKRLTQDPAYNISLGNKYLKELIDQFNGSYLLAIAAYNAGPDPVNKWIATNGDPRTFKHPQQVFHWIESIPYWETREYVQRVLENVQMYRKVLASKATLGLRKDLLRGVAKT